MASADEDKYQNFSDPSIKDRLSFAAAHAGLAQPKKKVKPLKLRRSKSRRR